MKNLPWKMLTWQLIEISENWSTKMTKTDIKNVIKLNRIKKLIIKWQKHLISKLNLIWTFKNFNKKNLIKNLN